VSADRRAWREVLVYGACLGVLIAVLHLSEYRFLVVERSVPVYAALVGALFAATGIGLGLSLRRRPTEPAVIVKEVPVPVAGPVVVKEVPVPMAGPFVRDEERLRELGITPRELEILELIAAGLSNREIGERLFVSENTVKTHSSRLLDKLGAARRTQAVQLAKEARLIP
jgi:DNA-binding CsgD family transcriptional regulator